MSEKPLGILERFDPKLLEFVEGNARFALSEGALPRKFKLLIAVALDATHGAVQGVRSLTQAAMQAGATMDEVMETLRVAQYIGGVGSVYTSAEALKELFQKE
ncbi:MAG: carboxymuconolactone decarboxylase family protein [Candidatus Bathyarchaeia archaeon]